MKKTILFLSAIILASIALDSCKKGEDDPTISFKSRKGRVAGDWKVTAMTSTNSWTSSGVTSTTVYTSNGTTFTETTTVTGFPSSTTTGVETAEYTFEKDGTYKYNGNNDGDIETGSGTWNFTDGVGDMKKKSQITMYEQAFTTTSGSGSSQSWTGNYVDYAYDLKELRSKKMVWYQKTSSASSGTSSTYESEITLEAK